MEASGCDKGVVLLFLFFFFIKKKSCNEMKEYMKLRLKGKLF